MALLYEMCTSRLCYDVPNARSSNLLLPAGARLPWQVEGAFLRLYTYGPRDDRSSLLLKVKPAGNTAERQGYLYLSQGYISKVTISSPATVLLDFNMTYATNMNERHVSLNVWFQQEDHAHEFINVLQKTAVGASKLHETMISNGALLINTVAGTHYRYRLQSRSWVSTRLAATAISSTSDMFSGTAGHLQSGSSSSSDSDADATEGAVAIGPQAAAAISSVSGASSDTADPFQSSSSSSSVSGACVTGRAVPIGERPFKIRRMERHDYNTYMQFDKEKLVDMLVSKDNELALRDKEVSRLKRLFANIQELTTDGLKTE